jgi:hypothetical protein
MFRSNNLQAEIWHSPSHRREQEVRCTPAAFLKLFRSRNAGFSCYNVTPSLRNVAPPPCLSLDIKDLLKEDVRFFWVKGGFLNEGKLLDGEDFLMGFWLKGNC